MKIKRKRTAEHNRKIGLANSGSKNGNWVGDNVSYSALHAWVERQLGKPKHCAFCQTTISPKYEWANISKTYKRDLNDWIRLCTKCHHAYDGFTKNKDGKFAKQMNIV